MKVGIPKETHPGEQRVAASPEAVKKLIGMGFDVMVEARAGALADFPDETYAAVGAHIVDTETVWQDADLVLKVRAPAKHPAHGWHEADKLKEGAMLISFIWPAQNKDTLERLRARKASVLATDCVPRISRAQSMDALSSMANIAGYRAVIEAAGLYGSFFTQQITAAGKLPPAKVLIIGAGVAGLAAVAAARGLGAVVRAFDTRAAVREQVQSLGAEFLEVKLTESGEGQGGYAKEMSPEFIKAEMELFAAQAKEVNIIITTALIPGKPAPRLITREHVELMKPGSVVVDMAAEQGGNCEVTNPGEIHVHQGVKVVGYTDLPGRLATTASQLYGNNLLNLLGLMSPKAGVLTPNWDDEVLRGALVTRGGEITWPPPQKPAAPAPAPAAAAPKPAAAPAPTPAAAPAKSGHGGHGAGAASSPSKSSPVVAGVGALGLAALAYFMVTARGAVNPEAREFVQHLTVFVMACFVGWQVIWNVSPALHTPLMSVTNAISGIIVLGGMLHLEGGITAPAVIVGAAAILLATINIGGGFLVTQRMLRMFRK
ncbi:MAG: Re/Si-specific NAD(P)(+) transhydrogenase subunit alpha [Deltaproteobacteria bacterium]|nr:Re/Si-specific NAD(P)(+) transhydrogenase subunit alpha [Deltaproteobacteria bacterium]